MGQHYFICLDIGTQTTIVVFHIWKNKHISGLLWHPYAVQDIKMLQNHMLARKPYTKKRIKKICDWTKYKSNSAYSLRWSQIIQLLGLYFPSQFSQFWPWRPGQNSNSSFRDVVLLRHVCCLLLCYMCAIVAQLEYEGLYIFAMGYSAYVYCHIFWEHLLVCICLFLKQFSCVA